MKSLLAEFKEFINRGNVIDMAVGIIIGAAFTAIVTSLTDDIINPLIKLITGGNGTDVAGLTIPVAGTENGIDFGAFISAIICLLYTSDAADDLIGVDLGGRRIIKKRFFSSRRRHTRFLPVSWARRCV